MNRIWVRGVNIFLPREWLAQTIFGVGRVLVRCFDFNKLVFFTLTAGATFETGVGQVSLAIANIANTTTSVTNTNGGGSGSLELSMRTMLLLGSLVASAGQFEPSRRVL